MADVAGDPEFAELVAITAVRIVRVQSKVLKGLEEPLTYRQYKTLARVQEGHSSIVALANLAHLTLPTVSQTVDGLVNRGLATRRQDVVDRRLAVVETTPLGDKVLASARTALNEVIGGLGEDMSATRQKQLKAALSELYERATPYLASDSSAAQGE